jgi:hypothetical protein
MSAQPGAGPARAPWKGPARDSRIPTVAPRDVRNQGGVGDRPGRWKAREAHWERATRAAPRATAVYARRPAAMAMPRAFGLSLAF